MAVHRNLIAGEWVEGKSVGRNINPSNLADVVGEYTRADAAQAAQAIAASTVRGYTAPVGLLGLTMTIARVRGVTNASISAGSGTKPFSGRQG